MRLRVVNLGRMGYREAYRAQCDHVEEVLAARQAGRSEVGRLLLVEHPPVITLTKRAAAGGTLIATPQMLAREGVTIEDTDRGGDITYHGPGQLVAYPILDLSLLNLGLHDYMRLLESVVIDVGAVYGVQGRRDPGATGVWVDFDGHGDPRPAAKIAAMGVRVRRWISMHGLALNVATNLDHFALIVPCGLAGRPVTSLGRELKRRGEPSPDLGQVQAALARIMAERLEAACAAAEEARRGAATVTDPA